MGEKIFKIRPLARKLDQKLEKKSMFFGLGRTMMGARWSKLVLNDRSLEDLSFTNISSLYLEKPRFSGQKTQNFSRFLTYLGRVIGVAD